MRVLTNYNQLCQKSGDTKFYISPNFRQIIFYPKSLNPCVRIQAEIVNGIVQ